MAATVTSRASERHLVRRANGEPAASVLPFRKGMPVSKAPIAAVDAPFEPARRAFDLRVRPTEARIEVDALMHNLREARRAAPRSRVMAVVKADAYGHGAGIAARAFLQSGADWLGVA